jgi:hypothetical protein
LCTPNPKLQMLDAAYVDLGTLALDLFIVSAGHAIHLMSTKTRTM